MLGVIDVGSGAGIVEAHFPMLLYMLFWAILGAFYGELLEWTLVLSTLYFDGITLNARHHVEYTESNYHSHEAWLMPDPLSSMNPHSCIQDSPGRKPRAMFQSCLLTSESNAH
jgi:hypothetical protein